LNSWTSGISCSGSCSTLAWEQRLIINTELRLDQSNNLIINSSPSTRNFLIIIETSYFVSLIKFIVTLVPPVLQLRAGSTFSLKIPTYDNDNDNVRL
jgi:hypothetical protein